MLLPSVRFKNYKNLDLIGQKQKYTFGGLLPNIISSRELHLFILFTVGIAKKAGFIFISVPYNSLLFSEIN